jgi:hypothetical protein
MADALVNYFHHLLRRSLSDLVTRTNSVKGTMNQTQIQARTARTCVCVTDRIWTASHGVEMHPFSSIASPPSNVIKSYYLHFERCFAVPHVYYLLSKSHPHLLLLS